MAASGPEADLPLFREKRINDPERAINALAAEARSCTRCDLFAPGKSFAASGCLRGFSHDSGGGEVAGIESQKLASDERCTLVVCAREEIPRLLGQAMFAPYAVALIGSEGHGR